MQSSLPVPDGRSRSCSAASGKETAASLRDRDQLVDLLPRLCLVGSVVGIRDLDSLRALVTAPEWNQPKLAEISRNTASSEQGAAQHQPGSRRFVGPGG